MTEYILIDENISEENAQDFFKLKINGEPPVIVTKIIIIHCPADFDIYACISKIEIEWQDSSNPPNNYHSLIIPDKQTKYCGTNVIKEGDIGNGDRALVKSGVSIVREYIKQGYVIG